MSGIRLLLLALLAAATVSCSGGAARVDPAAGRAEALLPAPSALSPRATSDGLGRYAGDSWQQTLPFQAVAQEGSFLNFLPPETGSSLADCSYALYYLPADDAASGALSISFDWWVEPDFAHVFAGIANRQRDAWEWEAVSSAGFALQRDPDDAYIDESGGILLALLAMPGAGPSSVALVNVNTSTGAGWQIRELENYNGPEFAETVSLEDVAIVQGRPAILYTERPAEAAPVLHLLTSSTAQGLGAGDWTDFDLGTVPAEGQLYFCLAEIDGAYGIAMAHSTNEGAGDIYYSQCASPDSGQINSGFVADNFLSADQGQMAWPELGSISGAIQVAFFFSAEGVWRPWYGVRGSALIWSISKVSDTVTPAHLLVDDAMPQIRFHEDKPLITTLSEEGETVILNAHWASTEVPIQDSDWSSAPLGEAPQARLLCGAELGGKPVFAAGSLYSFPQVFTCFELTGVEPLNPGSWTRTVLDNIGVSFSSQVQLFSLGDGLAIAAGDSYAVSDPRPAFLNAGGRTLQLFHGSGISNSAAAWPGEVVQHDSSGTILGNAKFIDLGDGQAAYASVQAVALNDSDTGTRNTIRWGVFSEVK